MSSFSCALMVALFSQGSKLDWPTYPYAGKTFESWVADSYNFTGKGTSSDFFDWYDRKSKAVTGYGIDAWINLRRGEIAHKGDTPELRKETAEATWRLIKKTITKFSLERGFEFAYTQQLGERQCHLQSALVSSILHRIGLPAGCVMVWKNPKGGESLLGHVCVVVPLDDKTFALLDCSEASPWVTHQGIYLRVEGKYACIEPVWQEGVFRMFRRADSTEAKPLSLLKPLDEDYIHSMTWYYRGERAGGGLLSPAPTSAGLANTIKSLRKSLRVHRENPLTAFQLGNALVKQKQFGQGRQMFLSAHELFRRAGWVSGSVQAAYDRAKAGE